MFYHIDPANGLPIYDQIVRQVKFAAANERLRPGELVPSVRELARDLAVNPNTVARAYRELQAEGIVATVRGTGLELTPQAPNRCRQDRVQLIRQRIGQALEEAFQSELALDEIRTLIDDELTQLKSKGNSR